MQDLVKHNFSINANAKENKVLSALQKKIGKLDTSSY